MKYYYRTQMYSANLLQHSLNSESQKSIVKALTKPKILGSVKGGFGEKTTALFRSVC